MKRTLEIWPSRLALEERRRQLAHKTDNIFETAGNLFTFEGQHSLIVFLSRQLMTQKGSAPLLDMGGPILIQELLAVNEYPVFKVLSKGRRFPHRLWRLLLQIKAAGLQSGDLYAASTKRLHALGQLLADYQSVLHQEKILDEADILFLLEQNLAQGGFCSYLSAWSNVEVKDCLWLRPLDIRFLRALARQLPVRVSFAIQEPDKDPRHVFALLRKTADILEADALERIEISWDCACEPIINLDMPASRPWTPDQGTYLAGIKLLAFGGQYPEVESLVRLARGYMEQGVKAHEIIIAFPDLQVAGQMAASASARLRVPLSFRRGEALLSLPMIAAFAQLITLPLHHYPRQQLLWVWRSAYLKPGLLSMLSKVMSDNDLTYFRENLLPRLGKFLNEIGYIDARHNELPLIVKRAGLLSSSKTKGDIKVFLQVCRALVARLDFLNLSLPLAEYLKHVEEFFKEISPQPYEPGQSCSALDFSFSKLGNRSAGQQFYDDAWIAARDYKALAALPDFLNSFGMAARQTKVRQRLSPARLWAYLKEGLTNQTLPLENVPGGVRIMRLEDALGLKPKVLLMGGLSSAAFPLKPTTPLINFAERSFLEFKAQLPVWRNEEEEYHGQVLRLLMLMADTQKQVVLSYPAADTEGRQLLPSFILQDMAQSYSLKIVTAQGSVFGNWPELENVDEPLALWSRLSYELLNPFISSSAKPLAQTILNRLQTESPQAAARWNSITQRIASFKASPEAIASAESLLKDPHSKQILKTYFSVPENRRLSPTSLEVYIACPYRWFWSRLMGIAISSDPEWDWKSYEEGQLVHNALACFFKEGSFTGGLNLGQIKARLQFSLEQAIGSLQNNAATGSELLQNTRLKILFHKLLPIVVKECAALAERQVLATEYELNSVVNVPASAPIFLTGRLDRMDVGKEELWVTDYKHSSSSAAALVKLENMGINSFQLPVYLAAASLLPAAKGKKLRGRILNTRFKDKLYHTACFSADAAWFSVDEEIRKSMEEKQETNLFNNISALWEKIEGGCFKPAPLASACLNCEIKGLCRSYTNKPLEQTQNLTS